MREYNVLSSRRERHFWPRLTWRLFVTGWILFCILGGVCAGMEIARNAG